MIWFRSHSNWNIANMEERLFWGFLHKAGYFCYLVFVFVSPVDLVVSASSKYLYVMNCGRVVQ